MPAGSAQTPKRRTASGRVPYSESVPPATLFEYLIFRVSTDVDSFKPTEMDIKKVILGQGYKLRALETEKEYVGRSRRHQPTMVLQKSPTKLFALSTSLRRRTGVPGRENSRGVKPASEFRPGSKPNGLRQRPVCAHFVACSRIVL